MNLTRRDFNKLALAAAVPLTAGWPTEAAAKFSSKFNGVQIGVETYSYRSLRDPSVQWSPAYMDKLMDQLTAAIAENEIDLCEFWVGFVEPPGGLGQPPWDATALRARESLRQWRMSRPTDIFERARKKFDDAGVKIYASMSNFDDMCKEEEIDWGFEIAKTLGTNIVTTNCTMASIKRAAPVADKHKMIVSAHSENAPFNPDIDGMVFGDNLIAATKLSPYVRITLDIGHFTAYGGDPVQFLRENHAKITNVHLKDRLKNHPEFRTEEDTPEWGKGNTPIKEVLQLMKEQKYPFPACIEYEYKGDKPAVVEVRRCLDYAKAALA